MIPKVFKKFIQELIDATNDKKIEWEQEDADRYVAKTKKATITLYHLVDHNEELSYFYFYYRNVVDGKAAQFRVSQENEDYKTMEKLANAAQISANRIEDDLKDFFS